jgi:hypothetical protein
MGDFNYKSDQRRDNGLFPGTTREWVDLLTTNFIDCFEDEKHITWKSGTSSSIIDYVFCNTFARPFVHDTSQLFINSAWTDHSFLSFSFSYQSDCSKGPGAWKANPFLARNKQFRSALSLHLTQLQEEFTTIQSFSTSQHLWDWVKGEVKRFVKKFQIEDLNWRKLQLLELQKSVTIFCARIRNEDYCTPSYLGQNNRLVHYRNQLHRSRL